MNQEHAQAENRSNEKKNQTNLSPKCTSLLDAIISYFSLHFRIFPKYQSQFLFIHLISRTLNMDHFIFHQIKGKRPFFMSNWRHKHAWKCAFFSPIIDCAYGENSITNRLNRIVYRFKEFFKLLHSKIGNGIEQNKLNDNRWSIKKNPICISVIS